MVKKRSFKPALLLILFGILLNVLLVYMTKLFRIPLYLDSIGTVIVAALGGALPGIAVGFFSNCITALTSASPDPMTLYYGFVSVVIAAIAASFSKKGLLLKWRGRIGAILTFALVGGSLGSAATWILYGFSFGHGVSAPLARYFYQSFISDQFLAQFSADMVIDLLDKLFTVLAACCVLHFLPDKLLVKFPLGDLYKKAAPAITVEGETSRTNKWLTYRKHSIQTKITGLILCSTLVLSTVALTIGMVTYHSKLMAQYSDVCNSIVSMMLPKIDADRIPAFLEGTDAAQYAKTEQDLYDIYNNAASIKYMYVYTIKEDGCHVVFDLDADNLEGAAPGTIIPFDSSFPYVDEVIAGQEIPPVITDDTFGYLLTVYKPISDSNGQIVAYAAADIDMQQIKTNLYTFFICIASLLFCVMILTAMCSIWYCKKSLLEPMAVLAEQAHELDFEGLNRDSHLHNRRTVQTGDELEEVFQVMCRSEDAIAAQVAELQSKNLEISHMQRNIIYTLANMVENRDENTGNHVRRTAAYVQLIGQKLQKAGYYTNTIDDSFIKKLCDSAPLHDIGKIKIPDAILNKPGKLTDEEFELMKSHTIDGYDILRSSLSDIEDDSWLAMASNMALYHHEKWNGSGYPRQLAGEQIPLCARIMAVSDVFDALVSARSYKPAYPFDQALQIIKDGAASHFDPKIVEVFLASKQEIATIMGS